MKNVHDTKLSHGLIATTFLPKVNLIDVSNNKTSCISSAGKSFVGECPKSGCETFVVALTTG